MTGPSPDSRLTRIRTVARALDSAIGIPGTKYRIGLDPLLGLVPGFGDLTGAALSAYIVLTGVQMGAPRSVVMRMIANLAIDTVVGSVPVLGDLFDAGWKSNNRNVALIERHMELPESTRTASRLMIAGILIGLIALAVVGVAMTFFVARWIVQSVNT